MSKRDSDRLPPLVQQAKTTIIVLLTGAGASYLLSALAATDLGRPLPDHPGAVIGARGIATTWIDWAWRPIAPRAWQAWPGAAHLDDPDAAPGRVVGIVVGDRWTARVVKGEGLFDTVWIESHSGPSDCGAFPRDEATRRLDELSRHASARGVHPTEVAPTFIPAGLSRECRGLLPDGTSRIAARMPDHHRPVFQGGFDAAVDDTQSRHPEGLDCIVRIDEMRLFGWPLRCFVVEGTRVDRWPADFRDNRDPPPPQHWSNGIGARLVTDPLAWDVELLPATGLPWKPLWLPFLANSLILGVPLTLAGFGVSRAARAGLAKFRRRGDSCPRCGYPRKGLARGAACPECREA